MYFTRFITFFICIHRRFLQEPGRSDDGIFRLIIKAPARRQGCRKEVFQSAARRRRIRKKTSETGAFMFMSYRYGI